jgi:hypothetical protein
LALVYLDESVFRHHRCRTPMAAFQTLLGLGTIHPPTTYQQITTRPAQAIWSQPDMQDTPVVTSYGQPDG